MQVTSSDLPLESKEKEKSHDDNHLKYWLRTKQQSNGYTNIQEALNTDDAQTWTRVSKCIS